MIDGRRHLLEEIQTDNLMDLSTSTLLHFEDRHLCLNCLDIMKYDTCV